METRNNNTSPEWDAIVVGGGSAGLSAALLLGRSRRRTLVVDAGSPRNRYADHMHGVLGNEGASPAELVRKGREEIARYGVERVEDTVEGVEEIPGGLLVRLASGAAHRARALVVASGMTDALPDIPGLAERWGTSVLHCPFCHGWEVADKRLGVLASSPMALHQAPLIRQWSERLTFFSAAVEPLDPAFETRLRSRGVEIVASPVIGIAGDGASMSAVLTADGAETPIDALFVATGALPHDGFLAPLELERTELPFGMGTVLAVDPAGRTSHPRIWAIGNVVNPAANVPMSIGAGAMTGGAVNGFLVEEDFALAAS